jgi:hypothetical protein
VIEELLVCMEKVLVWKDKTACMNTFEPRLLIAMKTDKFFGPGR